MDRRANRLDDALILAARRIARIRGPRSDAAVVLALGPGPETVSQEALRALAEVGAELAIVTTGD